MNPYEAPSIEPNGKVQQPSNDNSKVVVYWTWGLVTVTLILNAFIIDESLQYNDGRRSYLLAIGAPLFNAPLIVMAGILLFVFKSQAKGVSQYRHAHLCLTVPLIVSVIEICYGLYYRIVYIV